MTATLTLNMIQPGTLYSLDARTGDALPATKTSWVGHMWVTLASSEHPPLSFGFYPVHELQILVGGATGFISAQDDRNYPEPTHHVSFDLSDEQYQAALEFCVTCRDEGAFGEWAVLTHTCIDFAWAVAKQCGIPVENVSSQNLFDATDGALLPASNIALMNQTQSNYVASGNSYVLQTIEGREIAVHDVLSVGAEHVRGSATSDTLSGGLGADRIFGLGGDDVLDGGTGADQLFGGSGNDWLGYVKAGVGNESRTEIDGDGNNYFGGTGNDRISGSRANDDYLFRKGDGQDFVRTQGGADVLHLLPGMDLETGAAMPLEQADIRFIRTGLDLKVAVGASDSVTVVGWFDPQTQANRLSTVKLGDKTWTEAEITAEALAPAANDFTLIYESSSLKQYVIDHADGSSTRKNVHSSGAYELVYISAPPDNEEPRYLEQITHFFASDGFYKGQREEYLDGYVKEFTSNGVDAYLREGYPWKDLVSVTYQGETYAEPFYKIRVEALDAKGPYAADSWAFTSAQPLTADALGDLPWVLKKPIAYLAQDTTGALVIGQEGGPPLVMPKTYRPPLVTSSGEPVSDEAVAMAPLLLYPGEGEVAGAAIPPGGVLLDSSLSQASQTVFRDVQGNIHLEWATSAGKTTSVVLAAQETDPIIKTWTGALLDSTGWARAPIHIPSDAGAFSLQVPAEGVTLVLKDGMSLDDPTTVVTQHVRDLHIQFESGTELVLVDWAMRPAALTLQTTGAQAWSAAEVASHIQGYVGDPADNTYTVLTSSGQWVLGGDGNDVLWGGAVPGNDLLDGQGGDDRLYGRGGDDVLIGGNGVDFLDGGDGNDELHGSELNDELWGQAGNDRLYGGEGNDKIYGNGGQDWAEGGPGNDLVAGGSEDDVLKGDEGDDDVFGGAGNDELHGGSGVNRLYGEAGNDILYGGADRNVLLGGEGNDVLWAKGLYDELYGGGGVDQYHLQPHDGARRLLFEDAAGGSIDLSAYYDSGIDVTVQKASADQLILTTSNDETLVVNGWSNQTSVLLVGTNTWDWADVHSQPSSFSLFGW